VPAPFTELHPRPAVGRAYVERLRAGIGDAGPSGRVRFDAMARWLQDLAYRDVVDAGWERPATWFVRRLRVQVARFPVFAEPVELTTWCSGMGAAVAERRTSLRGAEGAAVETVSQWVHVDPVSQRPVPLGARFHEVYGPSSEGRRSRTKLHHPAPADGASTRPAAFRIADLDGAAHVNNAAFWTLLEDELAGHPADRPLDAEIEHRGPGDAGPVEVLADGSCRWICSPAGDVVASFVVVGPEE
jgi:acyl-ACP thioesterase